MKICIINQHVNDVLGGSEIQCDIIARELTKRGNDVEYIAVNGKGSYEDLSYHVTPVAKDGQKIADAVIANAPDIVYWRFNKHELKKAVLILRMSKIPVVFAGSHINDFKRVSLDAFRDPRDLRDVKRSIAKTTESILNHGALKLVNAITTMNPEYLRLVKHKTTTAIHDSMTDDTEPFSWPRRYVIWVANLKRTKRPEICVGLAKSLLGSETDVVMVGGIQDRRYGYFTSSQQLPQNLHYLGRKSPTTVNGIIRGSVALVHTCRPEGFGDNFIQAWLQGKPTVSLEFDPGGYIAGRRIGFVSGNDPDQFSKDVLTLLKEPKTAEQMGRRAQDFAQSEFNAEKNVGRLETFLYEVIDSYER